MRLAGSGGRRRILGVTEDAFGDYEHGRAATQGVTLTNRKSSSERLPSVSAGIGLSLAAHIQTSRAAMASIMTVLRT